MLRALRVPSNVNQSGEFPSWRGISADGRVQSVAEVEWADSGFAREFSAAFLTL